VSAQTTVTAAVVERDGLLLVTRRVDGAHLAGQCEVGESPEDCLVRELREELGVEAAVGAEIYRTTYAYADRRLDLRFFECMVEGDPRPLIGQEIRWVARHELLDLQFPPADSELVERLARAEERR
jgi:8-oxo-dGTP diphosphatase